MTILIDSREKRPWSFPEGVMVQSNATIGQGDYCLEGDGTFSIERKSANDFRGTVAASGKHWERFVRELRRMDEIGNPQKVVIVEGDIANFLYCETERGLEEPEVDCDPVFLLSRVAELVLLQRTAIMFARDEAIAAALAYHIFCKRLVQLAGRIK